jgi:hypothetical protein
MSVKLGPSHEGKDTRLRASENRVLRGIRGPKREAAAGRCRKLHNEELCNMHASLNILG